MAVYVQPTFHQFPHNSSKDVYNMTLNDLWREFHQFKDDYNEKHQQLMERLSRLEAQAPTWARSEDLATLRETVKAFKDITEANREHLDSVMEQFEKTTQVAFQQFETAREGIATKKDVEWLTWWIKLIIAAEVATILGLVAHLIQFYLRLP